MANTTLLVGYLGQGVAGARPVAPSADPATLTFYYSTDTTTLSFYDWNTAAWVDVSSSAGAALLGVSNAFTKSQGGPFGTLTDAANIAWPVDTVQIATVTLGGNRTLTNPTGQIAGQTYINIIKQDATGSRTLAYGTDYKWPSGTPPVLSTGANAVDIETFVSDGTNMYGAIQQNFA